MKELLERHIYDIYINEDKTMLLFKTNEWKDEFVLYETFSDCCSSVWFESINNPENIIDETIIGIEVKPKKQWWNDENQITSYGYLLKSMKGYTDIEFRNEAEGFYGGNCTRVLNFSIKDKGKESITLFYNEDPSKIFTLKEIIKK